jgi:ABC-type antimicrobial peptide transport system permease subunit
VRIRAWCIYLPARPDTQLLLDVTPPDGEILPGNVAHDLRLVGLTLAAALGLLGIVGVAGGSLLAAVIGGLLPARHAGKVSPLTAMRT